CPGCRFSPLETFKHVKNPRPYQRTKMPKVKCYFFLILYIYYKNKNKRLIFLSLQIGVQTNIIWTRH
ncbi:hypothetical protein BDF14DRAFT_1723534, partial [Spinellus fusiger]